MDTHGFADRAGTRALISLLVGHDADVAHWVGRRLGIDDFGPCTAIGILCGDINTIKLRHELIAGVVYNWYRQANIEITCAAVSPRWCTSRILRGLFSYPFEQLGCHRVTCVTEHTNESVRAFLARLGFREEGVMRRSYLNGNDAVIYGMLREECRWIGDRGKRV
jgi:RimJ/RimL family protein N-acetyltransferase